MSKIRRAPIPAVIAPGTPISGRRHQRLLQLSLVPATPYAQQLSIGPGRRALALSLAVLIPAFLLLLLLSFGPEPRPEFKGESVTVISVEATEISDAAPEPTSPERAQSDERPEPAPPQPTTEPALPMPTAEPKAAPTLPAPTEQPRSSAPPRIGVRLRGDQAHGPPNSGRSASRDTERVGTAPNGEPLYAAAWYREPREDELRGYLSTASGPGWGLIACRTAPDYRVEDCVGLDEYPNGSQITRAVLAASWAFRVRPPRLGGQPLVGAWVRIRIDYGVSRRGR